MPDMRALSGHVNISFYRKLAFVKAVSQSWCAYTSKLLVGVGCYQLGAGTQGQRWPAFGALVVPTLPDAILLLVLTQLFFAGAEYARSTHPACPFWC